MCQNMPSLPSAFHSSVNDAIDLSFIIIISVDGFSPGFDLLRTVCGY